MLCTKSTTRTPKQSSKRKKTIVEDVELEYIVIHIIHLAKLEIELSWILHWNMSSQHRL
jgi:hypothetical protein